MNKHRVLCSAVFFASVFAAASVFAKIERVTEKTFPLSSQNQSPVTVSIDSSCGSIRVEPGDVQSVRIVARQIFTKAATDAEADDVAKSLEILMQQNGGTVTASSKYIKTFFRNPPVNVDFEVQVPRACNVTLKTAGGNITTGDLSGTAKTRTNGGDVHLGKIIGSVEAHTNGGNIQLTGCTQQAVLETSGGDIAAGQVEGDITATTSGGNIKIDGAGGAVSARTSGGNIKAHFAAVPRDCLLNTSGGNMEVCANKNIPMLLDAVARGGRVRANDKLQIAIIAGGLGQNRLSGRVNGGGALMKLRTQGGDISVQVD